MRGVARMTVEAAG